MSEARPMIAVYSNFGIVYISDICIARHVTAHVTPSRDGSSFQWVLLLLFGHSSLPACSRGSGHRRRADGNGNDAAASSTPWGPRCERLDTETAGQREARLEANAAEWHKATGLSDGQAAAVQA